jgi:hypothetical protein
VAARDADYGGFRWFPEAAAMDDWLALYERLASSNGGAPDGGRRLVSWAREAGFADVTASASTWCFASPEDRGWWGGLWADRTVRSVSAAQNLERGFATQEELERIAAAWGTWAQAPDGWFAVLHGEVVCMA